MIFPLERLVSIKKKKKISNVRGRTRISLNIYLFMHKIYIMLFFCINVYINILTVAEFFNFSKFASPLLNSLLRMQV